MGTSLGRRWMGAALLAVAFAAGLPTVAFAASTVRASVGLGGRQANGFSHNPSISGSGRYVAFESDATDLVNGDNNGQNDIFVRDLKIGTTRLASLAQGGAQANDLSFNPSISANGHRVAFESEATNLTPGGTTPGLSNVFVRDLAAGTTALVSLGLGGTQSNGISDRPVISADGSHVAFESEATNLVKGDTNGHADVFVRDLKTGTTVLASVKTSGKQANADSSNASISADGRFVAFASKATNLAQGDTNNKADVFVHDLKTGKTTLVSAGLDGLPAHGGSGHPSISGNGRYVAFDSGATNLVSASIAGEIDVFLRDLKTGTTTLVSVGQGGQPANDICFGAHISADARYVEFESLATNLVPGGVAPNTDNVYVRDLKTGTTTLVSVGRGGKPANGDSGPADISADGSAVAFESFASNLVKHDTNGDTDVFVRR